MWPGAIAERRKRPRRTPAERRLRKRLFATDGSGSIIFFIGMFKEDRRPWGRVRYRGAAGLR
jgi:hypothetical protein